MRSTTKMIVLSQAALVGFIAVCVATMPHFLFERNEGGVSNYGVHAATVTFYSLAFGISSVCLLVAARRLPSTKRNRPIKLLFTAVGCSLLLVLLSTYPYKANALFDTIHVAFGIWIFCLNLFGALWLALVRRRSSVNLLLFGMQLIGFTLAVCTFLGLLHVLFVAQMLSMASFGGLLVTSTLPFNKPRRLSP